MDWSVTAHDSTLIIETSLLRKILNLGLHIKKTIIEKDHGLVIIDERIAWFFTRHKVLHFDELDCIDFSHRSSVGWASRGRAGGRRTATSTFQIDLVDRDGKNHGICSMSRRSGVYARHPIKAGMLGDEQTYVGPQGDTARGIVDLMAKYTGLRVR